MSNGYYNIYMKNKTLKTNRKTHVSVPQKVPQGNELSDVQLAAYNWLVDSSFMKLIDNVNKDAFVEAICVNKFSVLFKVGRSFGVVVTSPQSEQLIHIRHSIKYLVHGLQEKQLIPMSTKVDAIAIQDRIEILNFIVNLHQAAMKGVKTTNSPAELNSLSQWLISIGLRPPSGKEWFACNRPLFLLEDPLRNGSIFQKLCVIFRPEVFINQIPPSKSLKEVVERNRQALIILAEEGAIDEQDIHLAEDLVRGTTDAAEKLLTKIRREYKIRQKNAIDCICVYIK